MIEVLRGRLGETSLPVLLNRFHHERLSGAIQFSRTLPDPSVPGSGLPLSGQVYLRNGYPVEVLLPSGADPLGTVLFETGALDAHRYTQAQLLLPYGGFRIGELLQKARLIDRAALSEGLRAQTRRRLHTIFFLSDAAFQVFRGTHERGLLGHEPLYCEPLRIIYFGVRRAWHEQRLLNEVQSLLGQELRLPAGAAAAAARWLPPAEARACGLLGRGAWNLQDLLATSGLSDGAMAALLYSFLVCSLLTARPPAGVRPERSVRDLPRAAGMAYHPSDEPLPANQSSLPQLGRRVQLHQKGSAPSSRSAPRRAQAALVPLVPSVATPEVPGAAAPPSPNQTEAVAEPAPRAPPPLLTSLPAGRLKKT
jgi:hypothetical protein